MIVYSSVKISDNRVSDHPLSKVSFRYAFVVMTVGAQLGKLEVSCVVGIVHQFPEFIHRTLAILYSHITPSSVETLLGHGRHLSDVYTHTSDRMLVARNNHRWRVSTFLSCVICEHNSLIWETDSSLQEAL